MASTQKPKNPAERTQKVLHLSKNVTTPSAFLHARHKADNTAQFTSLFVRTYASVEEVERLLDIIKPDEYAYIVHDKDKHEDGSLKEPHIHLLVYKSSQFRLTKFLSFSQQASFIEIPRSKKFAYEYLTHKNNPDKVAYPESAIVEYHEKRDTFKTTIQEERENRNLNLLDDIGNLSRRQMAEKYGADYIKNYQRYEAFMEVVKYDDKLSEIDEIASTADATETALIEDGNGTPIELQLADHVALSFSHAIHEEFRGGLPSSREIVELYHKILNEWKEYNKRPWNVARYADNVKLDESDIYYGKKAEEIERAVYEARNKQLQTTGVYSEHRQLTLDGGVAR